MKRHRWMILAWKTSTACLASLGLLAVAVVFTPLPNVLASGFLVNGSIAPADIIVVLGGGTTRDGSLTDVSLRRVWYAVRLFKHGYAPYILFSTGVTSAGRASEASRMAHAALEMGVPAGVIVLEERSTRTAENAIEVAKLLRSRKVSDVLLVTHPTHMLRAVKAFKQAGILPRPAPTDGNEGFGTSPSDRARLFFKVGYESGAWVLYWWRGWI